MGWLFPICGNRRQCARCNREKILLRRGYGGTSVVVQAPTGSGKTYIFELLYPNLKTQAVFAVPTRAAPTRVHALHPEPPRSPIMHHKPLMINARMTRIDEVKLSPSIEHLARACPNPQRCVAHIS